MQANSACAHGEQPGQCWSQLSPWQAKGKIPGLGLSLAWCLGLLLSACQTLPPPPATERVPAPAAQQFSRLQAIEQFTLSAKLAVQVAGKGYTARMQWQHNQAQDDIAIFSPLGQQVAHIQRDAQQVSLTDQQGTVHQAQDVASLTERLLGWRLPLQGLSLWVLGAPHSQSPFQASYQLDANLLQLQQDGWQIDFAPFQVASLNAAGSTTAYPLPSEIRLQQGDIRLKLVIQHWQ